MTLCRDVRALQELFGNRIARVAPAPVYVQKFIFQTADDGDGYPEPNTANTYFGYLCMSLSFPKAIGKQTVSMTVSDTTGDYILNLGNGYIPEGTNIICTRINRKLYTRVMGPEVYYSEDGSTCSAELGLEEDDGLPESVTFDDKFTGTTPNPPLLAIGFDTDAWIVNEDFTDGDEDE